jgi:hypothetical protein
MLLMWMSWVPLGFILISTTNSFPMPKSALSSIVLGSGTKFWVGECRLVGFHEPLCRMVVARSQMGSEKAPHLFGHGDPPNLRRRYRRMSILAGSWVQHWIAVAADRLHHQKADLKSILLAMIHLLGYFLFAATVQLISRLRQVPYMHCINNSLMVQLLTDVPDPPGVFLSWRTHQLFAKSHNCGILIFFPDFTMVGGFADRYLLYFVCASCVYRRKYPTSARVYCGIVGCTVGQIFPKNPTFSCLGIKKSHNTKHTLYLSC